MNARQHRAPLYPAADFVKKTLGGKPYTLFYQRVSKTRTQTINDPKIPKIPRMYPPQPGADTTVIYDGSPAKYYNGKVIGLIYDALRHVKGKLIVAVEHGDSILLRILSELKRDDSQLLFFIGKQIDTMASSIADTFQIGAIKEVVMVVNIRGFIPDKLFAQLGRDARRAADYRRTELNQGALDPKEFGKTIQKIEQQPPGTLPAGMQYVKFAIGAMKKVFRGYISATKISTKRQATMNLAVQWPSKNYKLIQKFKREGQPDVLKNKNVVSADDKNFNVARAEQLAWKVDRFLKQFALRAPQMPPKVRNKNTGREVVSLYRGMTVTATHLQQLMKTRVWGDKGFMAFSRDRAYATSFGARFATQKARMDKVGDLHAVVLRIRTNQVPRGTPWIWFPAYGEIFGNKVSKNFMHPAYPPEEEVLLPPGSIRINNITSSEYEGLPLHIVDGTYQPDPFYLDRKHVPQVKRFRKMHND
jgi:hypothetical protein